jgi:thiamine-phosphate pyrophosphorylase
MPAEGAMGTKRLPLGAYVLTSSGFVQGRGHLEVALAAIEGGADAVQLRAPELSDDQLLPLAIEIGDVCRCSGVVFVVNDRVDVAVRSGADGVHLGQDDDLERARDRLGPERVLGVSAGTPAEARAAENSGADYLGVVVWSTATKPEAVPRGLDGLRAVVGAVGVPVIGIGGVDASNAGEVLAAGAAGVAVVSAVGAAEDSAAATRELALAISRWKAGKR